MAASGDKTLRKENKKETGIYTLRAIGFHGVGVVNIILAVSDWLWLLNALNVYIKEE